VRRSRLSQFNEIKAQLEAKGAAFVAECFKDGRPTVFYEIKIDFVKYPGQGYHIAECPVTDIRYGWQFVWAPWCRKRPSVEDVAKMRQMLDTPPDASHVLVCSELRESYGKVSWANPLAYFDNPRPGYGEYYSFHRENLADKLAYLIETYIPKEGQFKCHYCGKATDNAKKIRGTVIAAQYPNMRAEFDYCSGECNGHDQMAHEG
jgi:hypothetical protein